MAWLGEVLIEKTSKSQISHFADRLLKLLKPLACLVTDVHRWLFGASINRNIDKMFYLLGLFSILRFGYGAIGHLKWMGEHTLAFLSFNPREFRRKYGQHSYALITGFTEGIGLAFACELAKLGFHLLLVGRNQTKIQKAVSQIHKVNKHVTIKVIEVDFGSPKNNLKSKIQVGTEEIDVSIVVNNVGFANGGQFSSITKQNISNVFKINLNSMVTINKILLPRFKNRKHRSAFINLSSCTGVYPSPNTGSYPATKVYIDVMSRTLAEETKRTRIDILTYRPFGVSTPMMGNKRGPMMITPQECASTAIQELGVFKESFGGYKHKLSGAFFARMTELQRFDTYQKKFNM